MLQNQQKMTGKQEVRILDKADDSFVLQPLKDIMEIEFVVNEKSEVWIAYNKPFAKSLLWIEYDVDAGRLTFIGRGGYMHDYGEEILPEIRPYLRQAKEACVVQMDGDKIVDIGAVDIVIRQLEE